MSASRPNPAYTERIPQHRERWELFAAERSSDPDWLAELRAHAMDAFCQLGFPSTRLEEWRYTNVAPIAKLALEPAPPAQQAATVSVALSKPRAFSQPRMLMVNGRVVAADSERDGVRVESLARLREEAPERLEKLLGRLVDVRQDAKEKHFALWNTANLDDGVLVTIARNAAPSAPIHVVIAEEPAAGPTVTHPRLLVEALPGSQATLVVDHVTLPGPEGPALTNEVAEIFVGANARLDYVVLQRERDDRFHISAAMARVERDARFSAHTLTLGGKLVRNDLEVVLADLGAECDLRGLFVASKGQLIDNHTAVDHAMPHGISRELYKGILGAGARGVFRGRVLVRPGAQKTDATQSSRNLLLGDRAEIDTKPQLEIYADDVKCAHGATVGQLDTEALFYLQSRGIGAADARQLLTRAFALEIAEGLPDSVESVADLISEAVARAASQLSARPSSQPTARPSGRKAGA